MVSRASLRRAVHDEARRNRELRRLLSNLLLTIGPDFQPPAWWRDLDGPELARAAGWMDLAAGLADWPESQRWWNRST